MSTLFWMYRGHRRENPCDSGLMFTGDLFVTTHVAVLRGIWGNLIDYERFFFRCNVNNNGFVKPLGKLYDALTKVQTINLALTCFWETGSLFRLNDSNLMHRSNVPSYLKKIHFNKLYYKMDVLSWWLFTYSSSLCE